MNHVHETSRGLRMGSTIASSLLILLFHSPTTRSSQTPTFASPTFGLWLSTEVASGTITEAAGPPTFYDASDVLRMFGSLNKTDPVLDALMAPTGGSYSLQEKRSFLGSLDLLPTGDTGDVACQGSLNTEAVLMLGDDDAKALVAKWLVTVPVDATDGRVWDSSGQQYHQQTQGAWESAAEWMQMARLYAAHSGDLALFHSSQDRVLCYEPVNGGGLVNPGGSEAGGDAICAVPAKQLLSQAGAAANLGVVFPAKPTGLPFATRNSPRRQIAGAKRLVQRFVSTTTIAALRLPLLLARDSATLPITLCLADVASGRTVFNTTLRLTAPTNVSNDGWLRVPLSPSIGPGVYDLAITAAWVPDRHHTADAEPASWPTRLRSAAGGARVETWGYVHADTGAPGSGTSPDNNGAGCCAQSLSMAAHANATTLSSRLERGMIWQLQLAKRSTPSTADRGGGGHGDDSAEYGLLAVPDAYFNGVPATGLGTASASSMWDQVRMGWKVAYINMLFVQSIDAWIELERVGAVRPLGELPGVTIDSALLRAQVTSDIARQLGDVPPTEIADELGFLAWISCNRTQGTSGRAACDRDRRPSSTSPDDDGQAIIDVQMLADQAYAVALGVGPSEATRARLDAMVAQSRASEPGGGIVRNNLVPLESVDPRIVTSADKWDPVTSDGYCDPSSDGEMVYAGHCVCRNDSAVGGSICWGNFGLNQQNGGRVFSTQATLLKAGPYVGAVEDFTTTVDGLRKIASQLIARNFSSPLLADDRDLLRRRLPAGALRTMCTVMHHWTNTTQIDHDGWGDDLCSYYKDVTFGLRTDPKNVLLGFAIGHLGIRVGVNGTLSLHGHRVAVPLPGDVPTTAIVPLPSGYASRWSPSLRGAVLHGLNVARHGKVAISCNTTSTTVTALFCTVQAVVAQ